MITINAMFKRMTCSLLDAIQNAAFQGVAVTRALSSQSFQIFLQNLQLVDACCYVPYVVTSQDSSLRKPA